MGPLQLYSRGDEIELPADDADLETIFSGVDYTTVELDDGSYVTQSAVGEFSIFLFKNRNISQQHIKIGWTGQTDRAASESAVYLQIYNRTTMLWEDVASNNIASENEDFNLGGWITQNLDDYFDPDFQIACRVYQEAV